MPPKKVEQACLNLIEAQESVSGVAKKAGSELRQYFVEGTVQEEAKGGVDFATSADKEIDNFIQGELKKHFPESTFLTEETAPEDYSRFKKTENLWIIDPIDGTTNFSRKRPHFGISIALVDKGLPKLAVVYLPLQDELYTARLNTPTFLNGREVRVSQINTLDRAWVESGISWNMEKRAEFAKKWVPKLCRNLKAFTMSGSAVFDMAAVAKGEIDAFVFCGIKPWDQAATGLLIQKAGGKITTSEGKPWNAFQSDIVASNGVIHNQLLELIAKSRS